MTPTITIPDYAIEAGARNHFNRTKQSHELSSDFDIPAYKSIYIAAFNQALTAALAEMVKRGDGPYAEITALRDQAIVQSKGLADAVKTNIALRKAIKPFAEAASLARREGMMIRDLIGMTELDAAAKAMEGK
jgi:hypothetical protein